MDFGGRDESCGPTRRGLARGPLAAIVCASIVVVAVAPSCASTPSPVIAVVTSASAPPPPLPPRTVYGPISVESIVATRAEVGWVRDLARGELITAYDVVLTQSVASCPAAVALHEATDTLGCHGVASFPAECTPLPSTRARTELTERRPIDIESRCAGDATPYALPASGDVRSTLSDLSVACFEQHNRFRPESAWTSIYALTELRLAQGTPTLSGEALGLVEEVGGPTKESHSPRFCRDDAALLDGTAPSPSARPAASGAASGIADLTPLAEFLEATAPITLTPIAPSALGSGPAQAWSVPLTNAEFRREHDLWEACADPAVRDQAIVQERCLLLRQFDRFLRDAEDQARPQTPRGSGSVSIPSAPSSGGVDAGALPR